MKKLTFFIWAAVMAFAFSACNSDNATTTEVSQEDVNSLKLLRDDMLRDIDELKINLNNALASRDDLKISNDEMKTAIEAKDAEIVKMKSKFSNTMEGMASEITQLRQIKKQFNHYMDKMEEQLAIMDKANTALQEQVSEEQKRNRQLAYEISELKAINLVSDFELKKFAANSTRAKNIRVDIKKDGNKPTGSSKRAKEIDLSFAIQDLPADLKGTHEVYLSVYDAKGEPMKVNNPRQVMIYPNKEGALATEITTQQSKAVSLANDTRISFSQPIESRMNPGYYQANIYTNFGLIGSTQFQLR